jgi:hypothetical protein
MEHQSLLINRRSVVHTSCRFTYKSLIFLEINPKSTSYPPELIPPLSPCGRRSRGDTAAAWPAPCPKASIGGELERYWELQLPAPNLGGKLEVKPLPWRAGAEALGPAVTRSAGTAGRRSAQVWGELEVKPLPR